MFSSINNSSCKLDFEVNHLLSITNDRNPIQPDAQSLPRQQRPKIEFEASLQPIYTSVPSDFAAFVREVNKAFGSQWAPRSAFEEIFQFYLDRAPKEKHRVTELRKVMSEDYMTTYMLDAIEDSGTDFIRSLGDEWQPLLQILQKMSLNERRSFCCKLLYQRMKEFRIEELERSVKQPKPFLRETDPLTPEQQAKFDEQKMWAENLPENVRDAYLAPKKLQASYGVTVAQIQVRGYYMPPVEFMADFCVRAAYYFGLPCTGPVPLPRRIKRYTVIKSPFIYKKVQENFERRTYSRLVTIKDGHPDVVEMWLSYCLRNQFHGTGVKVHIFSQDYVGVGKTMERDVKQLVERDQWGVEGYNMLSDDVSVLKKTIDRELLRIEAELAQREDSERAKRVLQLRVDELLQLEGVAMNEAKKDLQKGRVEALYDKTTETEMKEYDDEGPAEDESNKEYSDSVEGESDQRKVKASRNLEMRRHKEMQARLDEKTRKAMETLLPRLPKLGVKELKKEVEWDKQQDEALRKHLLHIGLYAEQKGIGSLTREEYFIYVPFVLLPKYKGIHKDVFTLVEERDLLRVPTHNTGYLASWDTLSERKRYDLLLQHRDRSQSDEVPFENDIADTSRLTRILDGRCNRQQSSFLQDRTELIDRETSGSASVEAAEQLTVEKDGKTANVVDGSPPIETDQVLQSPSSRDEFQGEAGQARTAERQTEYPATGDDNGPSSTEQDKPTSEK